MNQKGAGKIDPNLKKNDSGITYDDMRSNDTWSICFLLLLTHNPNFAYCYTYRKENKDGTLINFNLVLFKKLLDKFERKFNDDRNLIWVIHRMIGHEKFDSRKLVL